MREHEIIGLIVEYSPTDGCAVVFFQPSAEDEPMRCTTCSSPEQLWATIQTIKRPLARIDMLRAQKRLTEAKRLQEREQWSIDEALRILNRMNPTEIKLVSSTNLTKEAKRQNTKANQKIIDQIDLDNLEIDI